MEAILERLLQLPPELTHSVGYLVLLIATICEGIPPLGLFVPGQNIVLIGGFLASSDLTFLFATLLVVCGGAWVGEIISYFLGKKYGLSFLKKYGKYVMISDDVLQSIEEILKKNLFRGAILSRFYGWTRGVLPFIAGSLKINFKKMLIYSVISSILRGTVFTLVGYFVGESFDAIADLIGSFLTRGIVIGIGIAVLFWYFKSEYNIFKKWFNWVVIGNILSLVLFSILAQRIYFDKSSFVGVDIWIQSFLIKHPFIDAIMLGIDRIFDFWFVGVLGLVMVVFLYRKKMLYYLAVFGSSILSAIIAFPLFKLLIQRERPSTALIPIEDYAFPSGHSTMAMLLCLLIRYMLQPYIKTPWKKYAFLLLMLVSAGLIGLSRIFLHVHRFTDVVGGFLLGFFIVTANIFVRKILFRDHLAFKKIVKKSSKKQLMDILSG